MSHVSAKNITLGVFSDVHLKTDYSPNYSTGSCTKSAKADAEDLGADQIALLGRLGCDAPPQLLQYILKLFNQVNAGVYITAITLNGDMVAHSVAVEENASTADIKSHY